MAMDRTQTLVGYNRAWTESAQVEIRACVEEYWTVDSTTWIRRWRRMGDEQAYPGHSVGQGCGPVGTCPRGAS
jgi:hypothetical protein